MENLSQLKHQRILSHFPNVAYNVVAIAASTGGITAVSEILSNLPQDFPAAITVAQHMSPNHRSTLAAILSRRTTLRVKQPESGEMLRPATVYVPVPNFHLVVKPNGRIYLCDTAKVNFTRPAADVLFESVATTYKARAIAVVLTGLGRDGANGSIAIAQHGGVVIASDQNTSSFFSMPSAAINTGKVKFVLPLAAIASTLMSLVSLELAYPMLEA